MAIVDNAAGITIDSSGQHMNSKVLDGLPAASATGQAVRYDEAVVTAGTHAFTAVQSGVTPTAAANLVTRAYSDHATIVVAAVTATALPTYTLTPGTLGVGDVITASSNGAFPTLADGATVTVGAANGGDLFLLNHGASATDNRVWKLTAQGSAGATWSATAYDGCDTSAKITGSMVRVNGVTGYPPKLYVYVGAPSPTVNTTQLFWLQIDNGVSLNEVIRYREDFCQTVTPTTGTMLAGSPIFSNFLNGTGAAFAIEADNSAAVCGAMSLTTGSTVANARAGWITSWVSSATNAAEGLSVVMAQNIGIHLEFVAAVPVLSTASKEYKDVLGLIDAISASSAGAQVSPNGIYIQYDRTNSVNWAGNVTVGGTPSITASGTVVDTNYIHTIVHKDVGSNTAHMYAAGGEIGTGFDTSTLNGSKLGLCIAVFSSVGTGAAVKGLKLDLVDITIAQPARRYR